MTKMKFCGLTRPCDIEAVNEIKPEYIGFVFAKKSKRYVTPQKAMELKNLLSPEILAVGVFVGEEPEVIAGLLENGTIDIAQLHGSEDEEYIRRLKTMTDKPIIKAVQVTEESAYAETKLPSCSVDYLLLDSGAGTGTTFNWNKIEKLCKPYFLAGGLSPDNVREAIELLHPYAVDVSSGIEEDGVKSKEKMAAFAAAVRKEERK
ncbi:MAG: phosphoribosylanthranilate isomerase [Roseburia sp.]|uniref:phosphoribosylanthranilate isomerase n=1 Tax=Roseburia sp. 831b TaxID=1261635 RepID=UPI0009510746|nr:phosphoribosylanthranilate isomerase [Roseburia sp. 831b]MCI5918097.1 phosphoribosylanthranilate isomerase [Roseburia sp.]MDD6217015.1 phosphoribosylanthranilate isomerase [Roseburia sp.]MDY5884110.1 phosphoribosylanthranilate isomerase [Roseburia sp.]WVK71856.1 phosphoribosylanthranilate isomerase [Roseburia sp. 831b]